MHLAWDARKESHHNGRFAPENLVMAQNALEAAVAAGVPRVILASSVHADTFWPPPDARLEPDHTPIPASPYGASKVFMEALGRHFAAHRGLEVVAIRFGGVTPDDVRPEDPAERPAWLPHEDCVSLVDAALSEPLRAGPFALAVGVGDWPDRVHEYSDELARRPRRRR